VKTIHLKFPKPQQDGMILVSDLKQVLHLLKDLYSNILKDDPLFHYFFEPDLIIRIKDENVLARVKAYLQDKKIEFDEYEYPHAPDGKYGEEKDGIIDKYLDLFLAINHANSVAALLMDESEHFSYMERMIHSAFNTGRMPHQQEGLTLMKLAELKLGKKLQVVISPQN